MVGLCFFPLRSADVCGAGTCDEPLRTSVWEAIDYLRVNILTAVIHSRCFLKTIIFQVQKNIIFYFSYYDATVDSISDDLTTCTVSFDKYGNTEIVKVSAYNLIHLCTHAHCLNKTLLFITVLH